METEIFKRKRVRTQEAQALRQLDKEINTSFEFIVEHNRVINISLNNTRIHDLNLLTPFKNLQTLHLRYTDVSDLSPLQHLKNLEELHLGGTGVSDLSPIENLQKLQFLGLRYSYAADISPLLNLERLEIVDLVGTSVSANNEFIKALREKGVEVIL